MKTKLDKELSGIRRLIALLLTDDASVESKLEDYAISQLEPLHDLKTTICEWSISALIVEHINRVLSFRSAPQCFACNLD